MLPAGVLDDVLEQLQVVSSCEQRVELVVDLLLSAGADLVVAALELEACVGQVGGDFVAQVHVVVVRSDGEVATLGANLVAEVRGAVGVGLCAGVPGTGDGIQFVESGVHAGVVANRVEDVELGLGAEECGVRDAGADQVLLGLAGNVARVAAVGLTGERVVHEEVDVEGLRLAEGVDLRRGDVGKQHHVGLVDRLESADRRSVECEAVLEHVLVESRRRDREVLLDAGQVAEPNVDVLDVLVRDVLDDLFGRGERHACAP